MTLSDEECIDIGIEHAKQLLVNNPTLAGKNASAVLLGAIQYLLHALEINTNSVRVAGYLYSQANTYATKGK